MKKTISVVALESKMGKVDGYSPLINQGSKRPQMIIDEKTGHVLNKPTREEAKQAGLDYIQKHK